MYTLVIRLVLLVLAGSFGGCVSDSGLREQLIIKKEDGNRKHILLPGRYTFRIFGNSTPHIALFHPESSRLIAIYKVTIVDRDGSFWKQIRTDSRMSRESRYYAVSSPIIPSTLGNAGEVNAGAFRADIYRGSPAMLSVLGRSKMVKIESTLYADLAMTSESEFSHVLIDDTGRFYAIPSQAEGYLLSFRVVEGISSGDLSTGPRLANLTTSEGSPATIGRGCTGNFQGTVFSGADISPITAICEAQAKAGAD